MPLKPQNFRSSRGWFEFEKILLEALSKETVHIVPENASQNSECGHLAYDIRIKCHGTKRANENFDLFYMQMFHEQLFEFDSMGWGVENSNLGKFRPDKNYATESALEKLSFLRSEILAGNTKHKQRSSLLPKSFVLPKSYVFVPLQTRNDYVIRNHSQIGVVDFIHSISRSARLNRQNVVFKLHPFSRRDLKILRALYWNWISNPYVFISDRNVVDLIKRAIEVCVINSGVGFESLVLGKPVKILGSCSYLPAATPIDPTSPVKRWLSEMASISPTLVTNWLCFYLSEVGVLLDDKFADENARRVKSTLARS